MVKHALEKGLHEVLHANDQLRLEQGQGYAFKVSPRSRERQLLQIKDYLSKPLLLLQGFHEQPICFPPTFKFVPKSDEYNLKRIPSWTDRVLFLCNAPPTYCALRWESGIIRAL
jgi:hypothetical protein